VSTTCPFAHSANIARIIKGLEAKIDLAYVSGTFGAEGWAFEHPDPIHHEFKFLHEVYTHSKKDYTGRVSVPVLYDITLDKIATNESIESIELISKYDGEGSVNVDLLSPEKKSDIEEFERLRKEVSPKFNFAVYAAGIAKTQQDYEVGVNKFFEFLDLIEGKLGSNRFVFGNSPTLVDIRVYVTYLRFIYVYRILFKLDKKPYTHYKNLNRFLADFYKSFNLQHTFDVEQAKIGYYKNFGHSIVPVGPDFEIDQKL